MSDLKSLLGRIKSVNSTKKITRVMQMIATSKLKQARASLAAARLHRNEAVRSLEIFGGFHEDDEAPKSALRSKKVLIVFSSDKGLCGGYNSSIVRYFRNIFSDFDNTSFYIVGKKSASPIRKLVDVGVDVLRSDVGFRTLRDIVSAEGHGAVFYCLYTKFVSAMNMYPELLRVPTSGSFIFHEECNSHLEPERKKLFALLYEKYICAQLYLLFRESKVSENMSRMLAMDAATKNAQDVGDELRCRYNTARQEKITKELIEVVSGAEVI